MSCFQLVLRNLDANMLLSLLQSSLYSDTQEYFTICTKFYPLCIIEFVDSVRRDNVDMQYMMIWSRS